MAQYDIGREVGTGRGIELGPASQTKWFVFDEGKPIGVIRTHSTGYIATRFSDSLFTMGWRNRNAARRWVAGEFYDVPAGVLVQHSGRIK